MTEVSTDPAPGPAPAVEVESCKIPLSWRDQPSHRAWLQVQSLRLLDVARGARLEHGFGWLGDNGDPVSGRPQPLWITARFTHVFALGELMGVPGSSALCDHGLQALAGDFADRDHGGWFAELHEGRPARTEKEAYGQAFVLLALSSATEAGRPGAETALRDALDLTERHFWREDEGACCESWDCDWQTAEAYRGANANMHIIEAFIAAADALGEPVWFARALRICERLVHQEARRTDWRIVEHFDNQWSPLPGYNSEEKDHPFRPFGVTPGHAFEWSRLLISLQGRLDNPPKWMIEAAEHLFARAAADGWVEPGGFIYTTDLAGHPVIDRRLHWVTTEAIAAAAALHALTGKLAYETWYRRGWDFAVDHLIDPLTGSWRHELNADLSPSQGTWSGRPDIYHALQATLIPRLPPTGSVAGALRRHGLT